MSIQNFNIVSAKSLEKQLKVVEGRIQELQAEVQDLEKIRSACLVLLGTSTETTIETSEPAAELSLATPRKKAPKRPALPSEEVVTEEPPHESSPNNLQ